MAKINSKIIDSSIQYFFMVSMFLTLSVACLQAATASANPNLQNGELFRLKVAGAHDGATSPYLWAIAPSTSYKRFFACENGLDDFKGDNDRLRKGAKALWVKKRGDQTYSGPIMYGDPVDILIPFDSSREFNIEVHNLNLPQ